MGDEFPTARSIALHIEGPDFYKTMGIMDSSTVKDLKKLIVDHTCKADSYQDVILKKGRSFLRDNTEICNTDIEDGDNLRVYFRNTVSRWKRSATPYMIARLIAEDCGITNTKMANIMRAIVSMARDDLRTYGTFTFPGMVRLFYIKRPAQAARQKNVFGKTAEIPARAARKMLRAQIIQEFKEAVDSDVD